MASCEMRQSFVVFGDVDAGQIEDEFGLFFVDDVWERTSECFEIARIAESGA